MITPAYGRRFNTVDIALGIILLLAIILIGYFALTGSHGQGGISKAGPAEVHFIDVGQGDAILVKSGDKTMLVDGGRQVEGPKLIAYLKGQGVAALDLVVSTHPHADHIGGLLDVLRNIPVKEVLDSGVPHTTKTYEDYLTLIDEKNIPFTVAEAGQTIDLGNGVTVDVLAPPAAKNEGGINENSIILKVRHGNVTFLLMGDSGKLEEQQLMDTGYDLKSDVYKVPHHGSLHSASMAFVSAVSPEISVIEVGENKYGHPTQQVLSQLEAVNSRIYRTDLNGNIIIRSDGTGFTVTPQYETPAAKALSCEPLNGVMRCAA